MTKTVALEDLVPFMDETPINEQTFIDFGFERCDVDEKDSEFHYYTLVLGTDKSGMISLCLDSSDDFSEVLLWDTEKSWKTVGELKTLLMLFADTQEVVDEKDVN